MRFGKWILAIFVLSMFLFSGPAMATDHDVATHDTGITHEETDHEAIEAGQEHGHADLDTHGQVAEHGHGHEVAGAHGAGEEAHGHGHHGPNLGEILPLWSCIPFACMLLSIALFPLLAPHFWHHHFGKISAFWAALLAIPFLIAFKGGAVYEIPFYYPSLGSLYRFRRHRA